MCKGPGVGKERLEESLPGRRKKRAKVLGWEGAKQGYRWERKVPCLSERGVSKNRQEGGANQQGLSDPLGKVVFIAMVSLF